MATNLDPQFGRDVLRCDRCRLVQFPTRSGNCRRCGMSYAALPEPEPIAVVPAPVPTPETFPEIGAIVSAVRQARELTLLDLAKRMGVSKQWLHQIETGARPMSIATVSEIADALEVAPGVLVQMSVVRHESGPVPAPAIVIDVPVVGCGA